MSGYSEAFAKVAELATKDGAIPINALPGCWVRVIDDKWTVAVNGHDTDVQQDGVTVPAFQAYVTYNGWPAGIFGPFGGVIAGGTGANEDTFIAALDVALA